MAERLSDKVVELLRRMLFGDDDAPTVEEIKGRCRKDLIKSGMRGHV